MDKMAIIALALAKKNGGGGGGGTAYDSDPAMDGTASAGSSTAYARGDHVHPSDTSRLATDGDGSAVYGIRDRTYLYADIPSDEPVTFAELLARLGGWFSEIDGAIPHNYTTVIGVSQWTLSGTTYSYDVTLTGLTATSTVVIEFSDKETEFSMSQSANTLTISTETLPSADVAIKVLWYKGA